MVLFTYLFQNLLSSSLVNGQSGQLHHHHLYLTPVKSPSPSNAQISATSSFYSRFASNSISHQLVSSNLTARTNGVIGSGLSNGPQIQQSFGQSCQTRTASGINNSAGNADVELKDRCEHQGSIYRRSLCDHCGEKFCDSCEISHKEKLKKEILSMSQTVSV